MLALTVDAAKNVAVAVTIGFVILALVAASAIKNVTYKIISVLLMAGLALGVWTQRSNLQDCAHSVKDKSAQGDFSSTTCEFFGSDVRVPGVTPTTTVP
jgi:high-affinity Fe2+/Pb2+ permease